MRRLEVDKDLFGELPKELQILIWKEAATSEHHLDYDYFDHMRCVVALHPQDTWRTTYTWKMPSISYGF